MRPQVLRADQAVGERARVGLPGAQPQMGRRRERLGVRSLGPHAARPFPATCAHGDGRTCASARAKLTPRGSATPCCRSGGGSTLARPWYLPAPAAARAYLGQGQPRSSPPTWARSGASRSQPRAGATSNGTSGSARTTARACAAEGVSATSLRPPRGPIQATSAAPSPQAMTRRGRPGPARARQRERGRRRREAPRPTVRGRATSFLWVGSSTGPPTQRAPRGGPREAGAARWRLATPGWRPGRRAARSPWGRRGARCPAPFPRPSGCTCRARAARCATRCRRR